LRLRAVAQSRFRPPAISFDPAIIARSKLFRNRHEQAMPKGHARDATATFALPPKSDRCTPMFKIAAFAPLANGFRHVKAFPHPARA
jgi:hypothetical protein